MESGTWLNTFGTNRRRVEPAPQHFGPFFPHSFRSSRKRFPFWPKMRRLRNSFTQYPAQTAPFSLEQPSRSLVPSLEGGCPLDGFLNSRLEALLCRQNDCLPAIWRPSAGGGADATVWLEKSERQMFLNTAHWVCHDCATFVQALNPWDAFLLGGHRRATWEPSW